MSRIATYLLRIPPSETAYDVRGFRGGENGSRQRFERIGHSFVFGYHSALRCNRFEKLVKELRCIDPVFRGFAVEGASMSLALLDRITPWRRDRIARFLKREGSDYTYLVHVGVGWAMARWPGSIKPILKRLDPVLGWLAIDGYGFHEGYFHWPSYLSGQPAPKRLKGYARRVFDQGLGRSLWFVEGAKVDRIVDSIQRFPVDRHADLWSGIGLACVYAGEISETDLYTLVRSSGRFHPHLAQGAAFAAKARLRGGNPTPYTEQACQCVCGTSAAAAAQITDFALQAIDHSSAIPTYEQWRLGIQQRFH